MPPKKSPNEIKTVKSSQRAVFIPSDMTLINSDSEEYVPPRFVAINITMYGSPPDNKPYLILALFNNKTILDGAWQNNTQLGTDALPINLNETKHQQLVLSNPIIFILRVVPTKAAKADQDHLQHPDNTAGGTVDLLPLLLKQEEVFTTVRPVFINSGLFFGTCEISVHLTSPGLTQHKSIPLLLTMVSANCMPPAKEGTVYMSAIGLTDIHEPKAVNFGMSLSSLDARYLLWASCSNGGYSANTAYSVIHDNKFIPDDLHTMDTTECLSFYWNAINRVLVDSDQLIERLSSPFLIEIAGVPKTGKLDVRGRYMGWVDARALLEPGQLEVIVCVKLLFYSEARTNNTGVLLSLPPTSAKTASARDTDLIFDEMGHNSYVVIRFDVMEPLIQKPVLRSLYDIIGFTPPEGCPDPIDKLEITAKVDDSLIDARFIRRAGGALAVHKELCNLAWRGSVPMNQGIKRSAANLLLMRVRNMLKKFSPGECSYQGWQETVTGQHAASRRAVTASFAPQPPPPQQPDIIAAARSRVAGDDRIAEKHISMNLKVAGRHPRSLICKTLRCLEKRNDLDAKNFLFEALSSQPNNRYLLWILGAQEFDKGTEAEEIASAAFRIAVKGDYSDGTGNAVAWAALHTFYHVTGNPYGAYVAAKWMRKYFLLPVDWKQVLKRWTDTSGEEEVFWDPSLIASENPILITAALFLCLRCYKFCESLLQCVDNECDKRGNDNIKYVSSVDKYYLWAALFIIRNQPDRALEITELGIKSFGPSALMSQMRVTCLCTLYGWNDDCELAFQEAEKAGAKIIPSVLYKSALARFKTYPLSSLQRAARVHELSPSGYTALLIGRIYAALGEDTMAQRWCAVAVKFEPLLSDGWALLSLLAMWERNLNKARTMLRTAHQVGPISPDIQNELDKVINIVQLDQLSDSLVKNLFLQRQ